MQEQLAMVPARVVTPPVIYPGHSHVHLLPIARMAVVHGALDDFRGQINGGAADLCRNSHLSGQVDGGHWEKLPKEAKGWARRGLGRARLFHTQG